MEFSDMDYELESETFYNQLRNANIDPIKLANYLEGISDDYKYIVNKVVENTQYFSTEDMIGGISYCLRKFHDEYENYNLYIKSDQIDISHYILIQLKKDLHPKPIIYGTIGNKVKNDYPILIITDFIHTSDTLANQIELLIQCGFVTNKIYIITLVLSTYNVYLNTSPDFVNVKIKTCLVYKDLVMSNLFKDEFTNL